MRRLMEDEDGAIAVMVGLLLVVLIGFAAIAVDVGALFSERRELQNGADAAVLAVAEDCASGDSEAACDSGPQGDRLTTARTFANSNATDGSAAVDEVTGVDIEYAASRATVTTTSLNDGEGFLRHWFAPILGIDPTEVSAQATAIWGPLAFGSYPTLPLTFSECEYDIFLAAGGGSATPPWTIDNNGPPQKIENQGGNPHLSWPECKNEAGQNMPGGFGWLTDHTGSSNKDECEALFEDDQATSDGGANSPCDKQWLEDNVFQNIILLPVFSDVTADQKTYTFSSYAAFYVTGYSFPGASAPAPKGPCPSPEPACIEGWFVDEAVLDGVVDPNAPDTGVRVVQLVQN